MTKLERILEIVKEEENDTYNKLIEIEKGLGMTDNETSRIRTTWLEANWIMYKILEVINDESYR